MNIISILLFEHKHFVKSKFKIVAFLLFVGSCLFSLNNGYQLFKVQNAQIQKLQSDTQKSNQENVTYFDSNQKGPKERPWVDITTPFWAIYYAGKNVVKKPSPLLPFSIGQTEQYGYYKKTTTSSTAYDADLAEEIANPERLGIGNLDFSFTLLYLIPILLIILLFNIGGLENDFQFIKLIKIQFGNTTNWLALRFLYYYFLILLSVFVVVFIYAFLTNALAESEFFKMLLLIIAYITLWFLGFLLINKSLQNSQTNAIKMISVWLLFCVLIPAFINQYASYKYPINYMTAFIDSNRDDTYKLYYLPKEDLKKLLLQKFPELNNTVVGRQQNLDEEALNNSLDILISELNSKAINQIEEKKELKNQFIRNTYILNPITFFQNTLNQSSNSDYYSFLNFRNQIEQESLKKQKLLLLDSWNKIKVDKQKYTDYINL